MLKWKPEWLEIIKRQDELLRFERFTNADALTIGLNAIEAGKAIGESFAFRVIAGGDVLFSYKMEGSSRYNDWWMDKKLNTSLLTGVSTLRCFAEIQAGERERPDFLDNDGNYAVEGGCVVLRRADGSVFGYVLASGASHELDHQVASDAVAKLLGVAIPSVAEA